VPNNFLCEFLQCLVQANSDYLIRNAVLDGISQVKLTNNLILLINKYI